MHSFRFVASAVTTPLPLAHCALSEHHSWGHEFPWVNFRTSRPSSSTRPLVVCSSPSVTDSSSTNLPVRFVTFALHLWGSTTSSWTLWSPHDDSFRRSHPFLFLWLLVTSFPEFPAQDYIINCLSIYNASPRITAALPWMPNHSFHQWNLKSCNYALIDACCRPPLFPMQKRMARCPADL